MRDACPVCDLHKTDALSIAVHNTRASESGCRRYPFAAYTPKKVSLNG